MARELTDYEKQLAERERRDQLLYGENQEPSDADTITDTLRLAKEEARINKELEKANDDDYNRINLTPEQQEEIRQIKKASEESGYLNDENYTRTRAKTKDFLDNPENGLRGLGVPLDINPVGEGPRSDYQGLMSEFVGEPKRSSEGLSELQGRGIGQANSQDMIDSFNQPVVDASADKSSIRKMIEALGIQDAGAAVKTRPLNMNAVGAAQAGIQNQMDQWGLTPQPMNQPLLQEDMSAEPVVEIPVASSEMPVEVSPEIPVAPSRPLPPQSDKRSINELEQLIRDIGAARTPNAEGSYIDSAMQEKRKNDAIAMMLSGASQIGAGLAGGKIANIKADDSMVKMYQEKGKDAVATAKEKSAIDRQTQLDKINNLYKASQILQMKKKGVSNAALDDPNSAESKKLQDMELASLKAQGIKYNEDDIRKLSANYLSGTSYIAGKRKSETQLQQTKEDRLKNKFGNDKLQKFQDDSKKIYNEMTKDPVYKMSKEMLSETQSVRLLIDDAYKKGGQSLALLGSKLAKGIAGEKGVLTDQDVVRYLQNAGFLNQARDITAKAASGKLSKVSKDNLIRLMNLVEDATKTKMDNIIKERATIFSRNEGIPFEDARFLIDSKFDKSILPSESDVSSEVRRKTKDGKVAIFDAKTKQFLRYE